MTQRPKWCQDCACRPIVNTPGCVGRDAEVHGHSGFCVGRLPHVLVTERGGVRHENDAHLCFRSPVRGVVMLEVKRADFDNVARLAMRALVDYDPDVHFNMRWYTGRAEEESDG